VWDALVTTAAGSVATILGILVGGLVGHRGQDRQWVRDTQTAAYVKFLQAFAATEIELREAHTAGRPNAADWESLSGPPPWREVEPWLPGKAEASLNDSQS
jgi:hypothetical protein